MINPKLSAIVPRLKKSDRILLYGKKSLQSIFDICYNDKHFSLKSKRQVKVQDHSLSAFDNYPHKAFNKSVLLLSIKCKRFSEYIYLFQILCCKLRVKFTKIGIKNANSNTILLIYKNYKILKNK